MPNPFPKILSGIGFVFVIALTSCAGSPPVSTLTDATSEEQIKLTRRAWAERIRGNPHLKNGITNETFYREFIDEWTYVGSTFTEGGGSFDHIYAIDSNTEIRLKFFQVDWEKGCLYPEPIWKGYFEFHDKEKYQKGSLGIETLMIDGVLQRAWQTYPDLYPVHLGPKGWPFPKHVPQPANRPVPPAVKSSRAEWKKRIANNPHIKKGVAKEIFDREFGETWTYIGQTFGSGNGRFSHIFSIDEHSDIYLNFAQDWNAKDNECPTYYSYWFRDKQEYHPGTPGMEYLVIDGIARRLTLGGAFIDPAFLGPITTPLPKYYGQPEISLEEYERELRETGLPPLDVFGIPIEKPDQ